MAPLALMMPGEKAEIITIKSAKQCGFGSCKGNRQGHDGNHSRGINRIEELGLKVGKTVEMLNNDGGGPMLLKIDEARIAIGRGMAMKIMVERSDS